MSAEIVDMEWKQFNNLELEDRVSITVGNIVGRSAGVSDVVPDHEWGYSLLGVDKKFPLALNGLHGEPNNGLAFVWYRATNSEAPAGVRVSGLERATWNCLQGVEASWLKNFVSGVSGGDWMTVNRIAGAVRSRLYDERMVWSTMDDQTKFDTLKLLTGGNEDAAFSLLVVGGAVEVAKNLRPESWVKSNFPRQDYSWSGRR